MNFLSLEQQYLIKLLGALHCLRRDQAAALLTRRCGTPGHSMSHIFRQTKSMGYLRERGGVLTHPDFLADPMMLRAVDVALAVFPDGEPMFERGAPPLLLTVCTPAKDLTLALFRVPTGKEQETCAQLDAMPGLDAALRVLVPEDGAALDQLHTQSPCALAYPDETGRVQLTKLGQPE